MAEPSSPYQYPICKLYDNHSVQYDPVTGNVVSRQSTYQPRCRTTETVILTRTDELVTCQKCIDRAGIRKNP